MQPIAFKLAQRFMLANVSSKKGSYNKCHDGLDSNVHNNRMQ